MRETTTIVISDTTAVIENDENNYLANSWYTRCLPLSCAYINSYIVVVAAFLGKNTNCLYHTISQPQ